MKGFGLLAVFLALLANRAVARVNVVTLPGRDSVQLTIYNSVDLTLVRETRVLTFRKGLNRLEFSWANTLIDPTSVELRATTHPDSIDVLDVSFPARVSNTLEWRIESDFAGEVELEIRYFTSGIRWNADYVVDAAPAEKTMTFSGNVRVDNQSGEDYENAQIRLIVGTVRLVEEIVSLARQDQAKNEPTSVMLGKDVKTDKAMLFAFNGAVDRASVVAKEKQIVKEELSEYFLYTVEGRDTIPNGWSKRLPSFRTDQVPLISLYKFEPERWGSAVTRFYRFTNSTACNLGKEPLPDGTLKAFRTVAEDGSWQFIGTSGLKYVPVAEQIDLELGKDREVRVDPKLINWEKFDLSFDRRGNVNGWTTRESWQVELQNSKSIEAVIDFRKSFAGDWSIESEHPYEQVDATKVKFLETLQPGQQKTFAYTVTIRHGTNATR